MTIKFTDTSDKRVVSGPLSLTEFLRQAAVAQAVWEVASERLNEAQIELERSYKAFRESRSLYEAHRSAWEKQMGLTVV